MFDPVAELTANLVALEQLVGVRASWFDYAGDGTIGDTGPITLLGNLPTWLNGTAIFALAVLLLIAGAQAAIHRLRRQQLDERTDDLTAARAANCELMAELNRH